MESDNEIVGIVGSVIRNGNKSTASLHLGPPHAREPLASTIRSSALPNMAMSIAHLSIPSRDQPYSIAELAKISEPTSYDSSRSIKDQLRAVETLRKQGQQHRQEGDYQSAFVYLARAATVVLEKLPTHPQYNSLNAEQKGALKDVSPHAHLKDCSANNFARTYRMESAC